jgi:hypothetical protein
VAVTLRNGLEVSPDEFWGPGRLGRAFEGWDTAVLLERARADAQRQLPAGIRYEIRRAVTVEPGPKAVAWMAERGWQDGAWDEFKGPGYFDASMGVWILERGVIE